MGVEIREKKRKMNNGWSKYISNEKLPILNSMAFPNRMCIRVTSVNNEKVEEATVRNKTLPTKEPSGNIIKAIREKNSKKVVVMKMKTKFDVMNWWILLVFWAYNMPKEKQRVLPYHGFFSLRKKAATINKIDPTTSIMFAAFQNVCFRYKSQNKK